MLSNKSSKYECLNPTIIIWYLSQFLWIRNLKDLAGNFWLSVSPEVACSQIWAGLQPPESFIRAEGSTFRWFCYKAGILVLGIMKRLYFSHGPRYGAAWISWHHDGFSAELSNPRKPKQKLQCLLWPSLGNHTSTMFLGQSRFNMERN